MHRWTAIAVVLLLTSCGHLGFASVVEAAPAGPLTCQKVVCPLPGPCQVRESETCVRGGGPPRCPAFIPAADGTGCNDGNACTQGDTCQAGTCEGTPVVCTASDQCHDAGICNPGTGVCSNPAKLNGTGCNDGNACTQGDTCQAGTCEGTPVVCTASDQCHDVGVCNPASGLCSNPAKPDGSACNLVNATASCAAGACAMVSCTPGFGDCDSDPSNGCEANLGVAQSTSPSIYSAGTDADLMPGYVRVASITNCGACGETCGGANSCDTSLCVPTSVGGVCRFYSRAQCAGAFSCSASLPGAPVPLEPQCAGPDFDGDGLSAQWETPQIDPYTNTMNAVAGVDLNCNGEISNADGDLIWHELPAGDVKKDIYVELRFMEGGGFVSDPILGVIVEPYDHAPPVHPVTGLSAVEAVKSAFAREGVMLHVDEVGQALPHVQLLAGISDAPCQFAVDPVTGNPTVNFYDYKGNPANHDPRRRLGYHYVVSGHSSCEGLEPDGSGVAEIPGNDLVVSMGGARYYVEAPSGFLCTSDADCDSSQPYTCVPPGVCVTAAHQIQRYREWAGTLMHELGHNLGLCHGGVGDATLQSPCGNASGNFLPNHISSMNYNYQLAWIFHSVIPGDPLPPLRVDFSHGLEPTLDETKLDETVGLNITTEPFNRDFTRYICPDGSVRAAPASGPIDWNCDSLVEASVSADINNDGSWTVLPAPGNEWANLFFKFQCRPEGSN
jgi:hypothetical protein